MQSLVAVTRHLGRSAACRQAYRPRAQRSWPRRAGDRLAIEDTYTLGTRYAYPWRAHDSLNRVKEHAGGREMKMDGRLFPPGGVGRRLRAQKEWSDRLGFVWILAAIEAGGAYVSSLHHIGLSVKVLSVSLQHSHICKVSA